MQSGFDTYWYVQCGCMNLPLTLCLHVDPNSNEYADANSNEYADIISALRSHMLCIEAMRWPRRRIRYHDGIACSIVVMKTCCVNAIREILLLDLDLLRQGM